MTRPVSYIQKLTRPLIRWLMTQTFCRTNNDGQANRTIALTTSKLVTHSPPNELTHWHWHGLTHSLWECNRIVDIRFFSFGRFNNFWNRTLLRTTQAKHIAYGWRPFPLSIYTYGLLYR